MVSMPSAASVVKSPTPGFVVHVRVLCQAPRLAALTILRLCRFLASNALSTTSNLTDSVSICCLCVLAFFLDWSSMVQCYKYCLIFIVCILYINKLLSVGLLSFWGVQQVLLGTTLQEGNVGMLG